MSNRQITVTVAEYTRLRNTASGNPRWALHATDGALFRTQADSQCANDINPWHTDRVVTLTLNAAGRVVGIEYVESDLRVAEARRDAVYRDPDATTAQTARAEQSVIEARQEAGL